MMLKQKVIEAALIEPARLSGHELSSQEQLILRLRISATLAARERHRQRIDARPYQWKKARPPHR